MIFNALYFTESVDSATCDTYELAFEWFSDLLCKNLDTLDETPVLHDSASLNSFYDFLLPLVFYVFAFEILLFLVMLVIAVFYDYEF